VSTSLLTFTLRVVTSPTPPTLRVDEVDVRREVDVGGVEEVERYKLPYKTNCDCKVKNYRLKVSFIDYTE